jgi:hypothetical protein
MNKTNPWDFVLNDTALDNEIAYKSVLALTTADRVSQSLYRVLHREMEKSDFETRDIFFTGVTRKGKS